MLGDTTTSVSSSVNPGGDTTQHHHHSQCQPHHNPNPPPTSSSSAAIVGGFVQEGLGEAGAAGARGGGAGHVGSSSGGEEDRFGGNRWPRQETLALLKIRTDMDATFRDASAKGPLWDDVSRKMGELGYHRSAKKCKEKFENVYKYHKRTKDGRVGKHEGKTYRYFEQLEAFDTHPPGGAPPPPPPQQLIHPSNPPQTHPGAVVAPHITTVPSTTVVPSIIAPPPPAAINIATIAAPPFVSSSPPPQLTSFPVYHPPSFSTFSAADLVSNSTSSASTSSDVEIHGRHKRKRKWKDFFGRLMTEVVQKQEEMQRKFLEAIEKREQERLSREESWRHQEMSRINREREILTQERSIAAAKDAAVMSFLQKLSDQQAPGAPPLQLPQSIAQTIPPPPSPITPQPPTTTAPPQASVSAPPPQSQSAPNPVQAAPSPAPSMMTPSPAHQHHHILQQSGIQLQMTTGMSRMDSETDRNFLPASSSRWPKVEVEALISLRTNLDFKYEENGPKGPLWEETSAGMKRLGYNRSSKRCKEKWENINKYFKKVKESNRKRPEVSKTCPYFHQLDVLYREKLEGGGGSSGQMRPEMNSIPRMVQPEQQWPPQPPPPAASYPRDPVTQDMDREDHDDEEEDYEDEDEDEDEDEGGGGGYELVSSKPT